MNPVSSASGSFPQILNAQAPSLAALAPWLEPREGEYLVQLYEAMDKKDEAAKWQKELEMTKTAQKPEKQP